MYTVSSPDKSAANIFGLLSDDRAYDSPAPVVYRNLMARAGMAGSYTAFKVDPGKLEAAVQGLGALNIIAANIGVPYQEEIIPHLFALSEGAKIIGAVNTIFRHGLYYKGYNTNALGLMDALHAVGFHTGASKSALVLGAGGAARAAVFLFHWLGIPAITVAARRLDQAKKLAAHLGGAQPVSFADLADRPVAGQIVVNATSSAGCVPELSAFVKGLVCRECCIVVNFNAADSQGNIWQELAERLEVPYMGGLPILGHQARHALALWTGVRIPPEAVQEIL
ncbi:MAG: hypothetical protein JXO49_10320 [Deltaproteobacteria bacterium]|nr:hypothetical protein [Candidatus Anaeroferrophillus wilburensis]MBN2889726.1 hypothetical protein [Deltaproteobacteria bacterium]